MRIADNQVKRIILSNVICFLLLASTYSLAQGDARGLVSKMVNNELEALKHPRYWIYLDSKARPERTELVRVIQMPECWFAWPLLIGSERESVKTCILRGFLKGTYFRSAAPQTTNSRQNGR